MRIKMRSAGESILIVWTGEYHPNHNSGVSSLIVIITITIRIITMIIIIIILIIMIGDGEVTSLGAMMNIDIGLNAALNPPLLHFFAVHPANHIVRGKAGQSLFIFNSTALRRFGSFSKSNNCITHRIYAFLLFATRNFLPRAWPGPWHRRCEKKKMCEVSRGEDRRAKGEHGEDCEDDCEDCEDDEPLKTLLNLCLTLRSSWLHFSAEKNHTFETPRLYCGSLLPS